MFDLFGRIVAVFDTPAGMAILGLAVLAFAGLFIAVFWDTIRIPRRDDVDGGSAEIAPPPLMAPELVHREADEGWIYDRPHLVRNGVLLGLGILCVVVGAMFVQSLGDSPTRIADDRAVAPGVDTRDAAAAPDRQLPPNPPLRTVGNSTVSGLLGSSKGHINLCREEGSLAELYVETCAGDAAVRFDLLRFTVGDQFVLRPTWREAAPTFVGSNSHAAPFTFSEAVDFATPETMTPQSYDGFLVIGVGEPGDAQAREEALRDFAIAKLSGGDRSECETSQRVYSMSAGFNEKPIEALKQQRAMVADLRKRARRDAKARAELPDAEERLAAMELMIVEKPAPIVVGISTDPLSSDPDQDMMRAAREFVRRYADELQIDVSSVALRSMPVCARGEASL
ncbi:hypothetical protein [Parvularcula lutaonensis]|uniref:Uncharacterized protein n=1 Tax=Parvularcula lutaonensis TaxID=491923 RepID=A0ABV7MB86_9PROT|nr:hypothetical protein [Parvularcula lutaonensis]GGY47415.1 hypothetical protein GCM10007148_15950 [Parvularcula lutaonensis]